MKSVLIICTIGNHSQLLMLLLAANHQRCLRLLQRYLDVSNDIQTVALLVARYCTSATGDVMEIPKDDKEQLDTYHNEWLKKYRQLLNKWEVLQ